MGLIVDTGIFIRAERQGLDDPLALLRKSTDVSIATITASELMEGIHHATNDSQRKRRIARIDSLLRQVRPIPLTLEIATVHAQLRATLRRRGQTIGAHDLIIAATAVYLDWGVATTNPGEFSRIEGLRVLTL